MSTTLYSKPTDSHNYLLYNSSHPQHCKNGLPFSQFLRVRRICSSLEDFDSRALTLAHHFIRKGYPQQLIENSLIKAHRHMWEQLLSPPPSTPTEGTDSTIYIITTYQPGFPGLKPTIQTNWSFFNRANDTKPLNQTLLVFGHRRSKNLREMLVRAKLEYPPKEKCPNSSPLISMHDIQMSILSPAKHLRENHQHLYRPLIFIQNKGGLQKQ